MRNRMNEWADVGREYGVGAHTSKFEVHLHLEKSEAEGVK